MTKATDPASEPQTVPQASPEGLVELEKILQGLTGYVDRHLIPAAIKAITALHDAEIEYVIGEDEPPYGAGDTSFDDDIGQFTPGTRNVLRAEQRQRWQERRGK